MSVLSKLLIKKQSKFSQIIFYYDENNNLSEVKMFNVYILASINIILFKVF